jgi:pimeloyl-ACP methyl ester carboxylesterase
MARSVEGAGVALNVVERGAGPPVLLIHGLAADAEAMAPVSQALAPDARVIAYDRRGYGSSGAPEPYRGTTVEEQAQDAAALLGALGVAAAVVCGDGFGALVALDLAKRHRALVRAAVLCDPPLFMFVPEATERLGAQHVELEAAVREGGPEAGVEAWLGGQNRTEPPPALERARAAHRAFFADYAGLASWPVTRRELRALDLPAVVLTGPSSPPHVVAAADALAALLPLARRAQDGDLVAATRTLLASR